MIEIRFGGSLGGSLGGSCGDLLANKGQPSMAALVLGGEKVSDW